MPCLRARVLSRRCSIAAISVLRLSGLVIGFTYRKDELEYRAESFGNLDRS